MGLEVPAPTWLPPLTARALDRGPCCGGPRRRGRPGRGGNQASLENGNAGRRLACVWWVCAAPGPGRNQAQENAERKKRGVRESECKAV